MDPLALLSNLHGDGPATLQRLRRHGCDTLSCLLTSPAGELAPILGWEALRTERFLREADVLMRRLGDGILDVEEDAPEPVAPEPRRGLQILSDEDDDAGEAEEKAAPGLGARRATDQPAVQAEGALELADAQDDDGVDAPQPLEPGEEELVDAPLAAHVREEVLTRWRTLDATETQAPTADTLVPHTPSAPLAPPGRPLSSAGIDGLDPVRIRALQGAGIRTLEELAAADDFELHQATGLAFTLVSRLTFLARRAVAKASPKPARQAVGRNDTAGPFA